jgi:uncharacterized pyridoxal phosphate-containing UPF0001 family protein
MVMAPLSGRSARRPAPGARVFEGATRLARTLPKAAFSGGRVRLSMGMSGDFRGRARRRASRIGGALFEGVLAGAERSDP